MNAVALDTVRVAKRLRDAIREGVTGGDLATKDDVKALKADLDTATAKLEAKIAAAQTETLNGCPP